LHLTQKARRQKKLAVVLGEASLTETDIAHLSFAREMEKKFISQKTDEERTIKKTLDIGLGTSASAPRF
jgi:V/A-type H+-transporting ATPase subunit B